MPRDRRRAALRRVDCPVSQADCRIAVIGRAQGMAVATMNTRDFSDTGIDVIDPWQRP